MVIFLAASSLSSTDMLSTRLISSSSRLFSPSSISSRSFLLTDRRSFLSSANSRLSALRVSSRDNSLGPTHLNKRSVGRIRCSPAIGSTHLKILQQIAVGVNNVGDAVGRNFGYKGSELNDTLTMASEFESVADQHQHIGAGIMKEAAAKTNTLAGDGTKTAVVLAQALISETLLGLAVGANPKDISKGINATLMALVAELKYISNKEVEEGALIHVAALSAGNKEVGIMINEAMLMVGRRGVVTIVDGEIAENMFHRLGYIYTMQDKYCCIETTDQEKTPTEYNNCKVLLLDKVVTEASDFVFHLEEATTDGCPILIVAQDFKEEALATLYDYKRRGTVKFAAVKVSGTGECMSGILDEIAFLTGASVIRAQVPSVLPLLHKRGKKVLGNASKVALYKLFIQIQNLNFRYRARARLFGGVAVIEVGAETKTERKDMKRRFEYGLNAAKAAVEEGIVVGGGCTLLRMASVVDAIKDTLEDKDTKMGASIFKRALSHPLRLIAENASFDANVVIKKVLSNKHRNFGFNAANGKYEDLIDEGVIDSTKVIRISLEQAVSAVDTFLTLGFIDSKSPFLDPN